MNVNYFKPLWRNTLVMLLFCFGLTSVWGQTTVIDDTATGTSIPIGWQGINNITSQAIQQGGYYLVQSSGSNYDYLLSNTYDNLNNSNVTIEFEIATYGSDTNSPLKVDLSTDGGTTWTGGTQTSPNTPTSSTYISSSVTFNEVSSSNVRFRFYDGISGDKAVRLRNIVIKRTVTTPSYTLTYTAGANGSIDGTSPQTVNGGQSGTAVTAMPNEGYHFVNWSDDSTDNPRTDSDVTDNISVTANFAINTYTVTYNGNGNTDGTAPTDGNTYNHGSNAIVLGAGDLVNNGFSFAGWNTQADGSGIAYTENATIENITTDIILYAQWLDDSLDPQTITFEPLVAVTYGDATFDLTATASSNLAVSYASSNENVATIDGNTVTIIGVGTTTITASQGGNEDYQPAVSVAQDLTVNAKNLTISGVTVTKPYDGTNTAPLDILGATLNGVVGTDDVDFATGTGEFADANVGENIAVTLTSNFTLTGTAAGNYTLTQPTLTGNILKAEQTVTLSDLNAYLGDEAITLPTVTDQGIAIEYISDNESVATVEGNVLNIVGLGTTEIFAGNNGSDNYEEFTVGFEITVTEAPLEPVTIAGWDFNSITGYGASPLIASVINENSEVGGLTRGSGVTTSGSAATRGWGGNGWNVTNQTTAISNNKYVTFTVKAIDGYTLSLSSIDPFEYRRSSSGAAQGMLQYSLNGTDFTDIQALDYSSSSSSGAVLEAIDLSSVLELQNVLSTTTVTFRIVNWGASSSTGTWYLYDVDNDSGVNDFSVNGHLSTTAPSYITWTTEDEWSNGTGPTIADDAIIEGDLTLTGNLSAKTLTVAAGGKITVPANTVLTVDGTITNNGEFTVENDGILIQNNDVTNTGAITVYRDSNPMFRLDYTLWSSPVAMNLVDFSEVSATSPTAGTGTLWNRVYTLGEFQWEQVWATQPDFDNDPLTFTAAKGYLYRAPNDWVVRNNPEDKPADAYPGVFTGVPNNGPQSISILNENNFEAIGNPYPSPINADLFISENIGTLYFWTNTNPPENNSYDGINNWVYYNVAGKTGVDGELEVVDNMPIQPGQGFVIMTEQPTVVFNNSMRTSNNGDFYKMMSNEKHRFWLNLSNEEVVFNQILVGYIEDATSGVDTGIDAKMFAYEGNALYSTIENSEENYVIQGRALPFEASDVVALGFRAVNAGSFTISLSNFDGLFAANQNIYLKDNYTQALHNLKDGAYSFVSEEGVFDTRFEVVYQPTMSVENPVANNSNWVVYSQENGFQVQTQGFELQNVQVYDLLGRTIYTANAQGTAHNIPSLGADSVYIVKVTTTENVVLSKKVK